MNKKYKLIVNGTECALLPRVVNTNIIAESMRKKDWKTFYKEIARYDFAGRRNRI